MHYSKLGYWGAPAAGIGLFVLGVLIITQTMPPGVSWLKACAYSALTFVSVVIALLAYRSADEVILDATKTAWFWGSMAACLVAGPIIIGFSWRLLPLPLPLHYVRGILLPHAPDDPQSYFVEGMVFIMLVQLAAFLLIGIHRQLKRPKQ